jgi:hypothetical protein
MFKSLSQISIYISFLTIDLTTGISINGMIFALSSSVAFMASYPARRMTSSKPGGWAASIGGDGRLIEAMLFKQIFAHGECFNCAIDRNAILCLIPSARGPDIGMKIQRINAAAFQRISQRLRRVVAHTLAKAC